MEELSFLVAARRGLPHLAEQRETRGEQGEREQDREVSEATAARRLHQVENSVPLAERPAAPLRTSHTPLEVGSEAGTGTQVAVLSVIGSSGTRRRYLSVASVSSDSG